MHILARLYEGPAMRPHCGVVMSRSRRNLCLYITDSLRERLDAAATGTGLSRSQYARQVLELWSEDPASSPKGRIEKQLDFLELATDALLKHHSNEGLRDVVHSTYRERLRRRQAREDV